MRRQRFRTEKPVVVAFLICSKWKLFVSQTGLYLIYRLIPLPNADRLLSAGRSLQVPLGQLRRITPGSSGAVPATVLLRLPAADRRGPLPRPGAWAGHNRKGTGSRTEAPWTAWNRRRVLLPLRYPFQPSQGLSAPEKGTPHPVAVRAPKTPLASLAEHDWEALGENPPEEPVAADHLGSLR